MDKGRITFFGNPWPEGHPIREFKWLASARNGQVWFDLHLVTEKYVAERRIEDEADVAYRGDWESPGVWRNFQACKLSSNYWHDGGFPVGDVGRVSLESLDGLQVFIDSTPADDVEEHAFHIYLLGHDTAAQHRIRFSRLPGTDRFNVHWVGKIALAYVGEYEYKHAFEANVLNIQAPMLPQT